MRVLVILLAVAACHDDAPSVYLLDAPFMCPIYSLCNPFFQTGCGPNERCAPVIDTSECPVAIACPPIGPVAVGGACTFTETRHVLVDDCNRGAMCVQGTCRQICDPQGGMPTCTGFELCETDAATPYIGSCSPRAI